MRILKDDGFIRHRGLDGEVIPPEPEDNRVGTKIIMASRMEMPIVMQQQRGFLERAVRAPVEIAKAAISKGMDVFNGAKKTANTPMGELK